MKLNLKIISLKKLITSRLDGNGVNQDIKFFTFFDDTKIIQTFDFMLKIILKR